MKGGNNNRKGNNARSTSKFNGLSISGVCGTQGELAGHGHLGTDISGIAGEAFQGVLR